MRGRKKRNKKESLNKSQFIKKLFFWLLISLLILIMGAKILRSFSFKNKRFPKEQELRSRTDFCYFQDKNSSLFNQFR